MRALRFPPRELARFQPRELARLPREIGRQSQALASGPSVTLRDAGVAAAAVGAFALGAFAVGALAVGAFAIGRLAIHKTRMRSLTIDELTVKRLRVLHFDGPRALAAPARASLPASSPPIEHSPQI